MHELGLATHGLIEAVNLAPFKLDPGIGWFFYRFDHVPRFGT
jgi:hypothetical protein